MDAMTDIQALSDISCTRLAYDANAAGGRIILRAGLLPYRLREGRFEFLFMKPTHKPGRDNPAFQICKGGRMQRVVVEGGTVHLKDIRRGTPPSPEVSAALEDYLHAAVREGQEELGVRLADIEALYDAGPVMFLSEKTAVQEWFWLYLAQMHENAVFSNALDKAVAQSCWLSREEFARQGRKDYVEILAQVWEKWKPQNQTGQ